MRYTRGNLLEARVEAVVNTVNTVGVMGKGIALMFKERSPKTSKPTRRLVKLGRWRSAKCLLRLGWSWTVRVGSSIFQQRSSGVIPQTGMGAFRSGGVEVCNTMYQ